MANKYISFADLYSNLEMPKKVKQVALWQDEAANAVKYFQDGSQRVGSIFKAFRDNQDKARIAFSDCKELSKPHSLYFLKVYCELIKRAQNRQIDK